MESMNYTFVAAADLSAMQYHIMRISNGVDRVNIASESVHSSMTGVLQNKPKAAGHHASVAVGPAIGKVVAGAAISSVAVWFTTNGSGRAIAATSGHMVCGKILETAAADGDAVKALLVTPFRLSGAV